ncbi:MAG: ABC transporter ATP-binding protein [Clostridia bacterium]|nr:ABC transporter ATP-binding protein [Clostridia bacterium]
MRNYYPLLLVGGIIGIIAIVLIVAYASIKDKKQAIGFDRHMKDGEILKRLIKYATPYKWKFLLVGFIVLFGIAYDILSPIIVGKITSLVQQKFELSALFGYVALYASILIVSMVCTYSQAIILQRIGQRIISNMREDLFTHIESLSHEQMNATPVGKLVTRVTNDTNAISLMFTALLVNLVKNMFIIVGVLAAMFALNVGLTLMVLCFVPFIVLFTVIFRKFARRAYRRVKDRTTDINTYLSENLSGIKITQIFNREGEKLRDFTQKSNGLGKAKREQILVFGVFRPLVYMLYISSVMTLFYIGGKGYLDGARFLGQSIQAGTIVTFYMFINKFYNPIQNLAEQFNWLQSAFASAEKVFTIMDIEPALVDAEDAIELEEVRGEIEFRDVWFRYVEDEWVLKGVSFRVEPKDTVAFVGATGSGKTTILSLICRNYEFQKGEILIDGIDIRKIKISSLRRHFGQMLQDVFLFSGTIRSNILMDLEGVSDEEVNEACRYVNADHFINRLENGLDEVVRERGNNFSAGQRQLLSFARTIIHKPSVMILDEATANIDTETEVLIQDSLEKLMNIGTMLIVAHRLSTIQHADNIIVLSKGEIVEQGSHHELLEKKGRYFDLYTLQYEKERLNKAN